MRIPDFMRAPGGGSSGWQPARAGRQLGGRKLAIDHLYPETAAARLGLAYVRNDGGRSPLQHSDGQHDRESRRGSKARHTAFTLCHAFTIIKVSGSRARSHDAMTRQVSPAHCWITCALRVTRCRWCPRIA